MHATITNDFIEEELNRQDMEMVDKLELMLSDDEELVIEGYEIDMSVDKIPSMRKALINAYDNGDITADEVCSFWWVELNTNKILMDKNIKCLTNVAHNFYRENGAEAIERLSSNIQGSYLHLQKIATEIEFAEELIIEEQELVKKERIIRDLRELVAEGLVQDCGGGTYKLREAENNYKKVAVA